MASGTNPQMMAAAGSTTAVTNDSPAQHGELLTLYGTGLGGLQLQVSPKDEVDARSILNDPGPPDGEVASVS